MEHRCLQLRGHVRVLCAQRAPPSACEAGTNIHICTPGGANGHLSAHLSSQVDQVIGEAGLRRDRETVGGGVTAEQRMAASVRDGCRSELGRQVASE